MNLAKKNGDSTTAWRVGNKRLQDFKKCMETIFSITKPSNLKYLISGQN